MSKCAKEVKVHNELKPAAQKEVAKKCDQKACLKYYDCATSKSLNPFNLTKKRRKGQFEKDYKRFQKELIKKCDPKKECEKSQKCSRKIYRESGYEKALVNLLDCKMEKCPLV